MYSSRVRSDDEEYSSDNDERGKDRYNDLLDSIRGEMGSPIENKLPEVCTKIWGKAKPKDLSGIRDEFKNILIVHDCSYLKTTYLNSEIYITSSKLHDAAKNRDKGTQ